jgi:hypothetical protein
LGGRVLFASADVKPSFFVPSGLYNETTVGLKKGEEGKKGGVKYSQ